MYNWDSTRTMRFVSFRFASRPGVIGVRVWGAFMSRTASRKFGGQVIELAVVEGTEGDLAVDITQLRAKTGLITLDPGLGNTGACPSEITFIDGEKGILRYRSY